MSEKPVSKGALAAIGIAVAVIVAVVVLFGDKENPYQRTRDRMAELETAIRTFAEAHGQPPASLSDLPVDAALLNDHLGEAFQYSVDGDSVTILSYGSDKEPGGLFFKKDLELSFEL